ncbi:MAG TPA: tripartite tricarboxylate transporter substrate binding protein [Burkholderiales bacterium]|nr:tripartite tricarboxylate transporter substrate binding protein [Burkholderiales bacterium]
MNGTRKKQSQVAGWLLLPLAVFVWPASTSAAEYPSQPLRLVVTYPPGGSGDFQARILGPKLSEQMGQQVVVDNRAGGSGIVALELVAKAVPNGYTMLLGPMSALTMNPALFSKLPYDTLRDFAPISLTSRTTQALAVSASLPANSVKELIALAKASPGKLSFGSTGVGNATHLSGEILKSVAGIDLVHVPYKGAGPQLVDVISGNVAMGFVSLTAAIPHVRTGRLKILMVTGKQRSSAAPDVPTATEAGLPEIDVAHGWFGILAPARTPPAVVSRLNTEIVRAVQTPDVQARFSAQGLTPASSTADEFLALIKSDLVRWPKIIKEAGLRAE